MVNLLTDPPSAYIRMEHIKTILGVQSDAVVHALLASPRICVEIDDILAHRLGDAPEMSAQDTQRVTSIMALNGQDFARITGILAVLTQAKAITQSVDGAVFTSLIARAGHKDIISFMCDHSIPEFPDMPQSAHPTDDLLQAAATLCGGFLMGLLPPHFQTRLFLHMPQDDFPNPVDFSSPDAKHAFGALFDLGLTFMQTHGQVPTDLAPEHGAALQDDPDESGLDDAPH